MIKNLLDKFKINGRDAVVLMISLLFAFIIWLLHNLSQNYSEVTKIYVSAVSDIPGHAQKSYPVSMMLQYRGRGFDILKLRRISNNNPVTIEFNSKDIHIKGKDLFYLTNSEINRFLQSSLSNSISGINVLSDTVFFVFPHVNNKKVPVHVNYKLDLSPQYTNVGPLKIIPDSVLVYGDPEVLKEVDRVYTENLYLEDVSDEVNGVVLTEPMKGVTISEKQIRYSLKVERYVEIVAKLPVSAKNFPKDKRFSIYPQDVQVKLNCKFPPKTNIESGMDFFIDYTDFESSKNGKCIIRSGVLPKGVFSYSVSPQYVWCIEDVK